MSSRIVRGSELEDKIKNVLSATYVRADDMSDGCGSKFEIIVVSE